MRHVWKQKIGDVTPQKTLCYRQSPSAIQTILQSLTKSVRVSRRVWDASVVYLHIIARLFAKPLSSYIYVGAFTIPNPSYSNVGGMTSRLVLCLGDLFIPDRAAVSFVILATSTKLTCAIGYTTESTIETQLTSA
jgi:hypothetical protein